MSINMKFYNISAIKFEMSQFQGVGKPAFVDILLHGKALLDKPYIPNERWN